MSKSTNYEATQSVNELTWLHFAFVECWSTQRTQSSDWEPATELEYLWVTIFEGRKGVTNILEADLTCLRTGKALVSATLNLLGVGVSASHVC